MVEFVHETPLLGTASEKYGSIGAPSRLSREMEDAAPCDICASWANRSFEGNAILREKQQDWMAEEEGFEPPGPFRAQRFSRRVIALWLAGKLLKTKDAVWLALDGVDTDFNVLG